jgi:hypothetical protein
MCWSGQGITIFTTSSNGPTLDVRTSIELKFIDIKNLLSTKAQKF